MYQQNHRPEIRTSAIQCGTFKKTGIAYALLCFDMRRVWEISLCAKIHNRVGSLPLTLAECQATPADYYRILRIGTARAGGREPGERGANRAGGQWKLRAFKTLFEIVSQSDKPWTGVSAHHRRKGAPENLIRLQLFNCHAFELSSLLVGVGFHNRQA